MAKTEEWTKGFPQQDGDYWSRVHPHDEIPVPIRIQFGEVFEFGTATNLRREYEGRGYEYLGPISPADVEQLAELRRVAQASLAWFEWWVERRQPSEPPQQSVEVLRQLRAALNPREIAAAIAGDKCPHGIYRHLIDCALCDSAIRGSKD